MFHGFTSTDDALSKLVSKTFSVRAFW